MTTLTVGTKLPAFSVEVDPASMKVFSLITCDPNPIHWDEAAVARAGLGGKVINQGGLNAAYLVNAVSAWLDPTMRIVATRFRFVANAFAGDVLTGGGEVVSVEGGVAVLDVWLGRSQSDQVLRGTVSVATKSAPDAPAEHVEEAS